MQPACASATIRQRVASTKGRRSDRGDPSALAFLAATKGAKGTWMVVHPKSPNGSGAVLMCVSIYARLATECRADLLSVVTADTAPGCELVHDTLIAGDRETRSTSGNGGTGEAFAT